MPRETISERLIFAGCIGFCLTLPVSNQLNNLFIGFIILGWLIEGDFKEKLKGLNKSVLLLPITFYLLHVFGLLYTTNFVEAFKHLETKAAILLLPATLGTTRLLTPKRIRTILKAFIIANLIVALFCLIYAFIQYSKTGRTDYFYYHTLTEVLDLHAIYMALYLAFSILIILYFNTTGMPLFNKTISVALTLSFAVYIMLLSALTILFVLPFLVAFLLTKGPLRQLSGTKKFFLFGGAMLILCSIVYAIPYTRGKLQRLTQMEYSMGYSDYQWGSLTIRLAKWKCAKDVLQDHWIAGVGSGDGQDALMESYRKNGFNEGIRNYYNTHNQYLETWIMLGVPGLILLLAMFWPIVNNNALTICFLVIMAISFLTENMLDTQKGVVFFSFFYSLLPFVKEVQTDAPTVLST